MTPDTTLFDPAVLQPYIEGRWLLLTPNRRLASRIRNAVAAWQGAAVAEAAPVLALADWLDALWQQLVFRGDAAAQAWVLSTDQALCLWEQCVRDSDAALLRESAAAEQALAAARVLQLWQQLPLAPALRTEFDANPDSRAFAGWLERFQQLCRARGCIDGGERDRRVVAAAVAGQLSLPGRVLGIGFDDIPPLYRQLLAATGEFAEWTAPPRNQSAVCVGFDTLEEQLQAAALWVREGLETDPVGPFAIVVPDLGQQRGLVERVLLDVFTPHYNLPGQARQLPPLNFSAGEALAQTPPVRSALQLLALAAPALERNAVLELLRSPFHALALDQTEAIASAIRAVCDTRAQQLRSGQLRAIADRVAARFDGWPFAAGLQQLREYSRREHLRSVRLPLALWAEKFAEILTLLGWPGGRTLDSIEFQQVGLWQQSLAELGRLDLVSAPVDFSGALQQLRQHLQARPFQPKTADAPVQVLGVLEAAGLQFKGLWLCDMGDDRWPAAAAPHPLLPRELQRRLRMPRCDAQREIDIATRLSHSLLANAERAVVSYQRIGEDVARAPSPLFRHLPLLDAETLLGGAVRTLLPLPQWQSRERMQHALESFAPGLAPPLDAGERARGGSGLFKDQADCPFRAFARHRLGAAPLAEVRDGLDAAERGNLVHAALEWLWRELGSHAALLALTTAETEQLAADAAAIALTALTEQRAQAPGPRFIALEQARLGKLLGRWLDVEKQRGAFTVLAAEQSSEMTFADLQLRLRVDRIDQLPDGRVLIVDYKTKNANCSSADWLGERPDEPQLPLYGALLEAARTDSVAGVLFAQVRLENPRLIGAGDAELDAHGIQAAATLSDDGINRDWAALKLHWRTVLEQLAAEFIGGEATVAPKKPAVCQYCALASVCRIDHRVLERGAEDAA